MSTPTAGLTAGPRRAHGDGHHPAFKTPSTTVLAVALAGFLVGGLTVSIADELDDEPATPSHAHGPVLPG